MRVNEFYCYYAWWDGWACEAAVYAFAFHVTYKTHEPRVLKISSEIQDTARHGTVWLWHGSGMAYNNNTDAARALNIEQQFIFFRVFCV